jgi:hypothetical protein
MSSQKWTISFVTQGQFKVGVFPADRLGRLQLKTIFVFIKWGSLAMSAGSKRRKCLADLIIINASSF